jgi:hypothetical protein
MSKASEARINVITRARSPEEIQKERKAAPGPTVAVSNGHEVELPASPAEPLRIIGDLAPDLSD